MQRFLCVLLCKISLFLSVINMQAADQQTLQVSQVRDVVKNIEIATQIGQSGQNQINSLKDLEATVFGAKISVLSVDMTSLSTPQLQSIAFGGYTFIDNPYNHSAGVTANILKDLLPLDFQQMAQDGTNMIYVGLFGCDASGNLLPTLVNNSSASDTTNNLDHFKLYIFKSDGTVLGTGPQYIPLNKYYSYTQQNFITPSFQTNVVSTQSGSSSTSQNFAFRINGQLITGGSSQISYPYLIGIKNISGVDLPNRSLNFTELTSIFSNTTATQINAFYQTLDSLEIILGSSVFSFNQNSLNQSTEVGANGICADISQYIAPFVNSGMQLIFSAVDTNGNIISDMRQVSSVVDHYLLYIFDQNSNLIKAVYVNPTDVTPSSSFGINQSANALTVRINGKTVTQNQQYSYPAIINASYSSGVQIPALASIKNQITLKISQTLSSFSYNLNSSTGASSLSLADKNLFGTNWLNTINAFLESGQTVLLNVAQSMYSSTTAGASGYELICTVYGLANPVSSSSIIAQQSFALPNQLSGLTIGYQTNSSKTAQALSASNLQSSWIVIIPSGTPAKDQGLSYAMLQKLSTYSALKAILGMKSIVYPTQITSNITQTNTIPGWYISGTKQFTGQGFSLQLNQMQGGNGYFFVEDKINQSNSKKFNNGIGVAALSSASPLLQDLKNTIVPYGSCTMILLGFDGQGNYIPDIIAAAPAQFGLFMFDSKGNTLPNSPVFFSVNDCVGLTSGKYQLQSNKGPATFTFSGLGTTQTKSLTYPFTLKVAWQEKGAPKPKPVPKVPTIPTNMTIPIFLGATLTKFGCQLQQQGSVYFGNNFMNTINQNLKAAGDSVQINITTTNKQIIATAYSNTQQIGQSKPISSDSVTSVLYTISGNPVMSLAASGQNNIWLQFQIVSQFSYYNLQTLSLSALQKIIKLNPSSIISTLSSFKAILPGWSSDSQGWDLCLEQLKIANGYIFVQNPYSGSAITGINVASIESTMSCSAHEASGTSIIQKCSGSCNMVLLGFDQNNNYMSNILDTTNLPTNFGLFMYDASGTILSGFPMQFGINNCLGGYKLISNPQNPATFAISGLGTTNVKSLTYPFLLTINWYYQHSM